MVPDDSGIGDRIVIKLRDWPIAGEKLADLGKAIHEMHNLAGGVWPWLKVAWINHHLQKDRLVQTDDDDGKKIEVTAGLLAAFGLALGSVAVAQHYAWITLHPGSPFPYFKRVLWSNVIGLSTGGVVLLIAANARYYIVNRTTPVFSQKSNTWLLVTDGNQNLSLSADPPYHMFKKLKKALKSAYRDTAALEETDEPLEEDLGLDGRTLDECYLMVAELRANPTKPGDILLKGTPAREFAGDGRTKDWPMNVALDILQDSPYPAFIQIVTAPRKACLLTPTEYKLRLLNDYHGNWLRRGLTKAANPSYEEYTIESVDPLWAHRHEHRIEKLRAKNGQRLFDVNVRAVVVVPDDGNKETAREYATDLVEPYKLGLPDLVKTTTITRCVPPNTRPSGLDRVRASASQLSHHSQAAARQTRAFARALHAREFSTARTIVAEGAQTSYTALTSLYQQTREGLRQSARHTRHFLRHPKASELPDAVKSQRRLYTPRYRWLGLTSAHTRPQFVVDNEELPRYHLVGDDFTPSVEAAIDIDPKDSTPPGRLSREHQDTFQTTFDTLDPDTQQNDPT